jgi:hypothetical protein
MIKYVKGNLFELLPQDNCSKIIPHVCNDIGGWGSGFVVPLGKKWPHAEASYREWHSRGFTCSPVGLSKDLAIEGYIRPVVSFMLGEVQFVQVEQLPESGMIEVANMIGQHETIATNPKPIRYAALAKAMWLVDWRAKQLKSETSPPAEIHCPKFGSGLAGGNWEFIEELIKEIWADLSVTIYYID